MGNINRNRPVVSITLSNYHINALNELVSEAQKKSVRRVSKSDIIEALLARAKVDKTELMRRKLMELESQKGILQNQIDAVSNELYDYSRKSETIEQELNSYKVESN